MTLASPPEGSTEQREGLLPATIRLGPVELRIRDLDRSIAYYTQVVGLELLERDDEHASLGSAGVTVVVLRADRDARAPGRHAGLYHVALRYPTREELARAAARIARTRTPIDGASDHGTHEAIYLPDPDGNGLELAADRPREAWPERHGGGGPPAPLDLHGLLGSVAGEPPSAHAAPGVDVGHLHLHVGDLEASRRFYCDGVGFGVRVKLPTAYFLAAGDYHHHLGFNVWRGFGVPPAAPGSVGLEHWTVFLGGDGILAAAGERLAALGFAAEPREGGLLARDPSDIAVLLSAAAGP
jgi:catechol 2,3-dioxygenase